MTNNCKSMPFVSVIVPVRNGYKRMRQCIEALLGQNYPKNRYEVLVIDNGSTDGTRDIIRSYPVTFLEENSAASPYVARNLGMKHAKGVIYAFTDGGCIANKSWLSEGVKSLLKNKAQLAGGKVSFDFSSDRTVAEIYDSMINIQMEAAVKTKGVGKGCNLFINRKVFEHLGYWPTQRSGGDVFFTGLATQSGYKMVYAQNAEVLYPARRFTALIKKSFRVGKGHPAIWNCSRKEYITAFFYRIAIFLKPPKFNHIIRRMLKEQIDNNIILKTRLILVAWTSTIAARSGQIVGIWKILWQHKGVESN